MEGDIAYDKKSLATRLRYVFTLGDIAGESPAIFLSQAISLAISSNVNAPLRRVYIKAISPATFYFQLLPCRLRLACDIFIAFTLNIM